MGKRRIEFPSQRGRLVVSHSEELSGRRICIYGDNDANADFDGQAFAFALARRLKKEERRTGPRQVQVFLPKQAGTDWADVWRTRGGHPPNVA